MGGRPWPRSSAASCRCCKGIALPAQDVWRPGRGRRRRAPGIGAQRSPQPPPSQPQAARRSARGERFAVRLLARAGCGRDGAAPRRSSAAVALADARHPDRAGARDRGARRGPRVPSGSRRWSKRAASRRRSRLLRGGGASEEPGAGALRDGAACGRPRGGGLRGPAWHGAATPDAERHAKRATFLIPAYCAAAKGDRNGASLALSSPATAGSRRRSPSRPSTGSAKTSTKAPPLPQKVDVLDYLFLTLGQAALARRPRRQGQRRSFCSSSRAIRTRRRSCRLAAAERAAALNIIDGDTLGQAYRDAAPKLSKATPTPAALRARLFAALAGRHRPRSAPTRSTRCSRAAKDAGIEIPMAEALAEASAALAQDPQAAGFAETGVRVAALAGDDQTAWAWVETGEQVRSWQLLLAASDPSGARAGEALDDRRRDRAQVAGCPARCCIASSRCSMRSTTRCPSRYGSCRQDAAAE